MIPYRRLLTESQEHLPDQPEAVMLAEAVADLTAQVSACSSYASQPGTLGLGALHFLVSGRDLPTRLPPPMDDLDPQGKPWISPEAIGTVRTRMGLSPPAMPPAPPP